MYPYDELEQPPATTVALPANGYRGSAQIPTKVVIQYFGERFDVPYLDGNGFHETRWVNTPTGQRCAYCDELIKDGDRGLMHLVLEQVDKATLRPVHAECDLRSLLGSPQHLRKQCNCYRDDVSESDGTPWREQARLIVAIINAHRAETGFGPLW